MSMRLRNAAVVACWFALLAAIPLSPAILIIGPRVAESWYLDRRMGVEFRHHRPLFEAIVRKVDSEVISHDPHAGYQLSGRIEDVARLDPKVSWDNESIQVQRERDGRLRIQFKMFDRGRLGVWTLNYYSRSRTAEELRREEETDLAAVTWLDDHWWSAVLGD